MGPRGSAVGGGGHTQVTAPDHVGPPTALPTLPWSGADCIILVTVQCRYTVLAYLFLIRHAFIYIMIYLPMLRTDFTGRSPVTRGAPRIFSRGARNFFSHV